MLTRNETDQRRYAKISQRKIFPSMLCQIYSPWNNYIMLQYIRHKQRDPEFCDLILLINQAEGDSH